jgi:8-oxo-dGTP pyrophosphatase MutT (NUDIX family)
MPFEKSAGAVVIRGNGEPKYLLLHYKGGHWDFVKGNIEEGESEKETVLRELEEETGIRDGRFIEGFRETINYIYKRKRQVFYKEVVFYLLSTSTKDVKLSFEHQGYDWLSYDEAMKRLTFKNAKQVLEKAKSFYKFKIVPSG